MDTCPLAISYWGYRPNIPANGGFLALFIVLMIVVVVQGVWTRKFKKYTIMTLIGCLMEIMGFTARLYAYSYPFSDVRFSRKNQ